MIPGTRTARTGWAVAALLGSVAATVILAQSGPEGRPAFDAASVKRSNPDSGGMTMTFDPGRLTLRNVTLKFCIEAAYHAKEFQLSGGPGWLASESYDIDARAAGPAKDDELRLMLQVLLAERFKLLLHRETRESPLYALVVAKSGIKIHEVEIGDGAEMRVGRDRLTGRKVPMRRFAEALSNLLGRPVRDMTGLSGVFDFSLTWRPDESQAPKPGLAGDAAQRTDDSQSSLFTALQEQLGLKLESQRGPVEIFVIDHAEKPTQN